VLNLVVTASAAVLVAVIAATGIASALSSTEGDAHPAPAGPPRSTYTVTRMRGDSQERRQEFVATVSDSGRRLVVHADP
jgi:hypothetical protein